MKHLPHLLSIPPKKLASKRIIPPASHIRGLHPWTTQEKFWMILSADLDGLLSGLTNHQLFGWRIGGFYDTRGIAMRPGVDPKECIAVDTEMPTQAAHSIGHHFALAGRHMLNVNVEAGVIPSKEWLLDPKLSLADMGAYFVRKYNLALILFLFYLYDLKLPSSLLARYLMLLADSSYATYYRYGANPRFHLQTMGHEELISFMDRHPFPIKGDKKDAHPFHQEMMKTVGPFLNSHGIKNPNNPEFHLKKGSERQRLQQYLVSLNSVFGFRPLLDPELELDTFKFEPLLYSEFRYSPALFPELMELGLWTNAITHCNKERGIVFKATTNFPKTEGLHNPFQELYPTLARHYVASASGKASKRDRQGKPAADSGRFLASA